jgi:hypothetical protein
MYGMKNIKLFGLFLPDGREDVLEETDREFSIFIFEGQLYFFFPIQ